jgi:AcrR family transcriptional regulator
VAEAAGFSKGAVYSNFASKDELFFELVAARIDRAIEAVREATQRQGARQGKVRDASDTQAIGRELRKVLDEDDEAWQMLILEFLLRCNRNESLKAKFLERRRAMRSKIADLNLALAKVSGIEMSRTESMNLATAVLALSNGLGIERIIDEDAVPSRLFGELLSRITFKR